MTRLCDRTDEVTTVEGNALLFRCDREWSHGGRHHAQNVEGVELFWARSSNSLSAEPHRTVYRLVADDGEEAWYELGLYENKPDAEADLAAIEAAYLGRPYWIDFRVDELSVIATRRTADELAKALIALADLSHIEKSWTDPKSSDSWFSEHGEPRPVR